MYGCQEVESSRYALGTGIIDYFHSNRFNQVVSPRT